LASIPLPSLDIKPPVQQEGPLDQYARLMQIQNSQQQQQVGAQQLQSGALDLQQKQLQAKAMQTLQQISPNHVTKDSDGRPTGYDYNGLYSEAVSKGVPPQLLTPLQTQQKTAADTLLAQSNAKKVTLENMASINKQAYEQLEGVKGITDPNARQQTWQQSLAWSQQNGLDTSQFPQQVPDNDTLSRFEVPLGMHAQALADAKTQAETGYNTQRANELGASAQQKALQTTAAQLAMSQNQDDYQSKLDQLPHGLAKSFPAQFDKRTVQNVGMTPDQQVVSAQGDQRVNTERQQLAVAQGHLALDRSRNDALTGGALPVAMQPMVDEIGTGKMPLARLDYLAAKNPALLSAVAQQYPDFDGSKVKSYTAAYRDFTGAGKYGNQLNAGSTALRHLDQLNTINNENPVAVHNPTTAAYKAYNNLLDTVADELGTFYGEPKTNEVIASKKATLGGVLNRGAAIKEQAQAMGVKFDELQNTWDNAAPSQSYRTPMPGYSQASMGARARLDPEYAAKVQQQSSTPQGASQQPNAGGAVPRAIGPNGHEIIVNNGRWVDAKTGQAVQ
jgi:hypothetical protein